MLQNLYSWFAYIFDTVENRRSEEYPQLTQFWVRCLFADRKQPGRCSDILIGIVEILVELFCGENELDDCNREINRLTPKLSAHTFVNAFTAL